MDEEPATPVAEFMMAIAGPIASVVIGAFAFAFHQWGLAADWSTQATVISAA